MKPSKLSCAVCGRGFKPRNNVERGKLGKRKMRASCGALCKLELRRLQQAERRKAPKASRMLQRRFA